ncbi:hypothetical protein CRENBAI_004217, partial [Crenichthys baileyi]
MAISHADAPVGKSHPAERISDPRSPRFWSASHGTEETQRDRLSLLGKRKERWI